MKEALTSLVVLMHILPILFVFVMIIVAGAERRN